MFAEAISIAKTAHDIYEMAVKYVGWQNEGAIPILFDLDRVVESSETILGETVGIEMLGGVLTPLFENSNSLPSEASQIFSTADDNQKAVTVHILSGDPGRPASEARSLGRFDLDGLPLAPKGVLQIEVVFGITISGLLSVKASEKSSGYTQAIEVGKLQTYAG